MDFKIDIFLPEICFFIVTLVLFLAILLRKKYLFISDKILSLLPLLALGISAASVYSLDIFRITLSDSYLTFWGSYLIDPLSQSFKLIISIGYLIIILNNKRLVGVKEDNRADYFLFITISAWGLVMVSSAVELITIYLAIEMASYSLYALIPLNRTKESAEAAIKYILFGAVATALALYGLSWIVAGQGTSYLLGMNQNGWVFSENPLSVIGLALFLVGMFYKLALFPFHFWCPDVYQGASNQTAAYVATLPKLGAIVVLIRLFFAIAPGYEIANIIAILAAISMTFGNLCALVQKDLKRMLGFSSVAHAGYIVVALLSDGFEGQVAASFYAFAYVLMNLLCFWVICRVSVDGRNIYYKDLNGLSKKSPVLAFALATSAFALVGLPPTIGFIGKLLIITSSWGTGYNWLIILLCLNSAIAIYYYLSLVRHAYTEDHSAKEQVVDNSFLSLAIALILAVSIILFGILPEGLIKNIFTSTFSLNNYYL